MLYYGGNLNCNLLLKPTVFQLNTDNYATYFLEYFTLKQFKNVHTKPQKKFIDGKHLNMSLQDYL